jgi:hypothetical protein
MSLITDREQKWLALEIERLLSEQGVPRNRYAIWTKQSGRICLYIAGEQYCVGSQDVTGGEVIEHRFINELDAAAFFYGTLLLHQNMRSMGDVLG